MKTAILWFRNDLRVRDNEALTRAAAEFDFLIPVYCLDDSITGSSSFGFRKTGLRRMEFIQESLEDLHQHLQKLGSGLVIRKGLPLTIFKDLIQEFGVSAIVAHRQAGANERQLEDNMVNALSPEVEFQFYQGSTLFHLDDLPFEISNLPDIFTTFRKIVEKDGSVREEYEMTDCLPPLPEKIETGTFPSMESLKIERNGFDQPKGIFLQGGESVALERLQHYFFDSKKLAEYKVTRNQLLGWDYSSKFSAWLAQGCISPRTIYFEVRKFEKEICKNDSTYWLIFELMWRDYFHFVALKYGASLFQVGGIRRKKPEIRVDNGLFNAWCTGNTGIPFIDANMRELNSSGYMSNRGRQNVASFLAKDLKQDWRFGAAYFEQQLIDYDVASNWGNWAYVAGVGNDPRDDRYFDVLWQARQYDREGAFVKHWIPQLAELTSHEIHTPWLMSKDSIKQHGLSETPYAKPVFQHPDWIL